MEFENVKFDFRQKNVLVVGGSKGIGKGIVEGFVTAGASVYYASRTPIPDDTKAVHIMTDLRKTDEIHLLFEKMDKHGGVNIVVNSASINYSKKAEDISIEEWDEVMDVNMKSMFIVCKESIKRMKKNRYGKIVNISSIAGRHRSPVSGVHYVSSKAGIIGLTKQLAFEVAAFNININVLCPSQTATEMFRKTMTEEQTEKLVKNIPLNKLAEVRDHVGPIMFLCSDAASYMTGSVLDVNGGQI